MRFLTDRFLLALGFSFMVLWPAQSIASSSISIVPSNNQFGYALTKTISQAELARNPNQNIFISPVSTAMALQMLLNGAGTGSATYVEIAKSLGVDSFDLSAVNRANQSLLTALQSTPTQTSPGSEQVMPFTLMMANSIWNSSKGHFNYDPSFVATASHYYEASTGTVDFTSPEGAASINQWASSETNGKVTNVIDEQTLKSLELVMMNATYFKANWLYSFEDSRTHEAPFILADGTKTTVQMMRGRRHGYVETKTAQVMELPYSGGTVSMYIVLPKEGIKLSDALQSTDGFLSAGFWDEVKSASSVSVDFALPKFGFNYEIPMNDSLKTMGIGTLFTSQADLTRLGTPSPAIDLIKQDTFINVDEKGTEAAAVTFVGGITAVIEEPTLTMTVDRPFLISIVEKSTGSVLFTGVISNPK